MAGTEAESMPPRVHIFLCSSETYPECMERSLFGSNRPWPLEVRKGDYCLLYHYDAHALFGLWQAESDGARRIEPKAWRGKFPYQVRVRLITPDVTPVPDTAAQQIMRDSAEGRIENTLEGADAQRALRMLHDLIGSSLEDSGTSA